MHLAQDMQALNNFTELKFKCKFQPMTAYSQFRAESPSDSISYLCHLHTSLYAVPRSHNDKPPPYRH